jgi:hypothetical protein
VVGVEDRSNVGQSHVLRRPLEACAALHGKAREISHTVKGRFRLGVRADTGLIPLGELVQLARQRFPALALDVHQVSSLGILGAIQSGEFDAGFALIGRLPAGLAQLRPDDIVRRFGPVDVHLVRIDHSLAS